MAGKSTLNRLELTPGDAGKESRYKKIVYHPEEIERFFVEVFLRSRREKPGQIILDLDATDDPIHGIRRGGFFMDIMEGTVICRCIYLWGSCAV